MEGGRSSGSVPEIIEVQNENIEMTRANGPADLVSSVLEPSQIINIGSPSTDPSRPPHLLQHNEPLSKYLEQCVPLYNAALSGDWKTANGIVLKETSLLTAKITGRGQTVLHLVAGTKHLHFVDELVKIMRIEDMERTDDNGNAAMSYAAATGSVEVAKIIIGKNEKLATTRGSKGVMPLYLAALFGRSEMSLFLYDKSANYLNEKDRSEIFFTCIRTGLYDLALKMLRGDGSLAKARDADDKTALHLLAETPLAFGNRRSSVWSKLQNLCMKFVCKRKCKRNTTAFQLLNCLWQTVIQNSAKDEVLALIRNPSELLFTATELGNFEFLAVLIDSYPDLIWETDDQSRTIIHVAVLHRQASIFNLIHNFGSIKDLIASFEDDNDNNILHLAAKLPHPNRLNTVSGPAFQMQQELLWFEGVKKIVQPLYIKRKNGDGQTPEELFVDEHTELLERGEVWMKKTAKSCMIVSTLIATVVFAAAVTVPGGNNTLGAPNYLKSSSFLIFSLSDGVALLSSTVAIFMFLSILTSHYKKDNFLRSLPLKLMIGLTSLFLSIVAMMIAFSSTFFIDYQGGLKSVPLIISIFSFVPILSFGILEFSLLFDTFNSTYCSKIYSVSAK